MKTFKKSVALLLSILMVFSVLGAAVTASADEATTAYFVNTQGWESVAVHMWVDGGEDLTKWPGEAATLVEGTDNVYSVDFKTATKIIFNNNDNGIQTANLDVAEAAGKYYEPKTAKFYATAQEAIDASTDKAVDGTAYFVNTMGWDAVAAHVWNSNDANPSETSNGWPGEAAEVVDAEKGVYSFTFTNRTHIIFNNNVAEGTQQTEDLKATDAVGKYYEPKTKKFYATAEEALNVPTTPTNPAGTDVVYFVNTVGWENVNGHIWNGSGDITTWPGLPATLVEENVYSFDVTNATGLVFHNNAGTQTGDIVISADVIGKYYDAKSNAFYATAQEALDATDPTYDFEYFVVGTEGLIPGGWNETPRQETAMTKGEDGIYTFVINNAPVGSYEIKVKGVDGKWYPEGIDNETAVNVKTEGEQVVVTFDPAEGYCKVAGQENPSTEPTESTVEGPKEYTIVGYINGVDVGFGDNDWQTVVPEYTFKDGKVTITFEQDSYIFVKTTDNKNWYNTAASSEGPSDTFFVGGPEKMKVPAGTIEFTLVENADGSLTVSYAPATDEPTTESTEPTTESTQPTTKAPSLSVKSRSLKAGQTYKIKVKNTNGAKVTYKTTKKTVATVDSKGNVTALAKGTAKITVKVGKKSLTFTAKVTTDPTVTKKVTISKKGKTAYIKVTGKASAIKNKYTLTKSGKKIVKVLSNTKASKIKIKGLKKGTTTLTIKVNGVKNYKVKVIVKK